jgi:hypothetical protein
MQSVSGSDRFALEVLITPVSLSMFQESDMAKADWNQQDENEEGTEDVDGKEMQSTPAPFRLSQVLCGDQHSHLFLSFYQVNLTS